MTPGSKDRPTDAELLDAARAGDREAFGVLVERYQVLVRSVAFALCRSLGESEEVAQEAFAAAWRQLPTLRQPDRFRYWLYRITRNLTRESQRAKYQDFARIAAAPVVRTDQPSGEPSPLDRMITREEEQVLCRALGAIPESYRVPIVLFYGELQSVSEVARALGVSETSIKTRLSRGRKMLTRQVTVLLRSHSFGRTPAAARSLFVATVLANISTLATGPTGASPRPIPARRGAASSSVTLVAGVAAVLLGPGLVSRSPSAVRTASVAAPGPPRWIAPVEPHAALVDTAHVQDDEAAAAATRVVVSFDFEDGTLPDAFSQGQVVPCPTRRGESCLIGTLKPWWWRESAITYGSAYPGPPVLHYASGLVISFDYWLGSDADTGLMVDLTNDDRGDKYRIYVSPVELRREIWAHAELRLADFWPTEGPKSGLMVDGDSIRNVQFMAGRVGGKPFYIDNLKIAVQPR